MGEVALSQSNIDKLRLCEDMLHTTDLNEAVQRLCKAASDESRRAEALQLFSILSTQLPVLSAGSNHATHAFTAELVLASLRRLCDHERELLLDDRALLYIVAYTDTRDSWTTHSSSLLAASLVASYESAHELDVFITGPLLHGYLRPLMSGSSARVTAAGRPAHFPLPLVSYSSAQRSRWKEADPPVVPLLRWATDRAHSDLIEHHWPLFLPGLLTLIEDEDVSMKDEGLRILSVFLRKVPSEILHSTGTGSLLEHAVSPMLQFLPESTNDHDCVNVLHQVFHVLFGLADVLQDSSGRAKRLRYDKIVRDGIVAGQLYASQNPLIVEVLIRNTTSAISILGIFAARHLRSLLGTIESVMTDPFAFSYPPLVMAAARMLHTILSSCWPRIISNAAYTGQLYRIIAVCWLSLHDGKGTSDAGDRIDQLLRLSASMLQVMWRGEQPDALTEVFGKEPRLRTLFLVDP